MKINEKDYLTHYGTPMHSGRYPWGSGKQKVPSTSGSKSKAVDAVNKILGKSENSAGSSSNEATKVLFDRNASIAEKNAAILKVNPDAHVLNLKKVNSLSDQEKAAINKKIRNVAIGVGIGITVAAGAILYAKNKDAVDNAIKSILQKKGEDTVEEFTGVNLFEKVGIKCDTEGEANTVNMFLSWHEHGLHAYDEISQETVNALDDTDLSLKPGQIIKRVTENSNEVLRDGFYASFEENDNNRYIAFLPALRKFNASVPDLNKKSYSMSMEAVKEITSPSSKKRFDILVDLLNQSKQQHLGEDFTDEFGFHVSKDPEQFARTFYNALTVNLCNEEDAGSQKYFAEVLKRGYNALVDDNDAGKLTKTPLILLDSKAVKINSINEITKEVAIKALETIQPIAGESFENSANFLKFDPEAAWSYQRLQQYLFYTGKG